MEYASCAQPIAFIAKIMLAVYPAFLHITITMELAHCARITVITVQAREPVWGVFMDLYLKFQAVFLVQLDVLLVILN